LKKKVHPDHLLESDARYRPAYSLAEAARYLRLPRQTVRNWVFGTQSSAGIVQLDDPSCKYLSFMNLVEAHVISGISRHYGIRPSQLRSALEYVRESLAVPRPLIVQEFKTDGKSLFIEHFGEIVNASLHGQITMDALLTARLERIDRDGLGLPVQLHPYTRLRIAEPTSEQPKLVSINPLISFGRPSIRGIATSILWDRYAAGDDMRHLAADYGLGLNEIEEAIRCEAIAQAA
jgi:uncharacterized protein (DUF433 family)